jgi:hypothetical protein
MISFETIMVFVLDVNKKAKTFLFLKYKCSIIIIRITPIGERKISLRKY